MYTQDEFDAAAAATAAAADVEAAAMLDITFLNETTDRSGNGHVASTNGNAQVMRDGIHFDGAGDDVAVSNFDYARDGTFTISLWFTKEQCTGGAYEYLFSHHNNAEASYQWERSYVDVFLGCESSGGGFSTAGGTVIRTWMRDTAGHEACMDYPLHDAGAFDAITNVWVHTILTVSPSSLKTFDDGILVPDSEYGYFNSAMLDPSQGGAFNNANPAPSSLVTPFSGSH